MGQQAMKSDILEQLRKKWEIFNDQIFKITIQCNASPYVRVYQHNSTTLKIKNCYHIISIRKHKQKLGHLLHCTHKYCLYNVFVKTTMWHIYRQTSNISHIKSSNFKCFSSRLAAVSICPILWSQMLCREWWCSWGSTDRRYSHYIWVINNIID